MLKLLLDEHISPHVAEGLRRRSKNLGVYGLVEREEGQLLGAHDQLILQECAIRELTLVTYDRRTIPPLLKKWAEPNRQHGGVIFVDDKTIPPSDFGGLIRAIQKLLRDTSEWDWTNRICFLRR